MAFARDMAV